jgi:hypothetical protein
LVGELFDAVMDLRLLGPGDDITTFAISSLSCCCSWTSIFFLLFKCDFVKSEAGVEKALGAGVGLEM